MKFGKDLNFSFFSRIWLTHCLGNGKAPRRLKFPEVHIVSYQLKLVLHFIAH